MAEQAGVVPLAGCSETEALAAFVLDASAKDLPAKVIDATKRITLDTVSCAWGGLSTDSGRIVAKLKNDLGGTPQATVFGSSRKLPATSAAYIHSHLANALDFDETLFYRTHHACSIVSSALAVGELAESSGAEVVTAIAVGFDVAARIALALPDYVLKDGVWGFSPIRGYSWAAFGVASAAGRLLGLSKDQLCNAFGLAYQMMPLQPPSSAPPVCDRPMAKYAPYGMISEAGINAVQLSSMGFTARPCVLDKKNNFWKGLGAAGFDWDLLLRELGSHWFIADASTKVYPVSRLLHLSVDLFRRICEDGDLGAEDIQSVVVRVSPIGLSAHLGHRAPIATQADAAANLPYALAMVAARIPPGPQWQQRENMLDESHLRFAEKVRFEINPEWLPVISDQLRAQGYYRKYPAQLEVRARNRAYSAYGEYAKGDPWTEASAMAEADLVAKFRECARGVLGASKVDAAAQEMLNLDRAESLKQLMGNLAL